MTMEKKTEKKEIAKEINRLLGVSDDLIDFSFLRRKDLFKILKQLKGDGRKKK